MARSTTPTALLLLLVLILAALGAGVASAGTRVVDAASIEAAGEVSQGRQRALPGRAPRLDGAPEACAPGTPTVPDVTIIITPGEPTPPPPVAAPLLCVGQTATGAARG